MLGEIVERETFAPVKQKKRENTKTGFPVAFVKKFGGLELGSVGNRGESVGKLGENDTGLAGNVGKSVENVEKYAETAGKPVDIVKESVENDGNSANNAGNRSKAETAADSALLTEEQKLISADSDTLLNNMSPQEKEEAVEMLHRTLGEDVVRMLIARGKAKAALSNSLPSVSSAGGNVVESGLNSEAREDSLDANSQLGNQSELPQLQSEVKQTQSQAQKSQSTHSLQNQSKSDSPQLKKQVQFESHLQSESESQPEKSQPQPSTSQQPSQSQQQSQHFEPQQDPNNQPPVQDSAQSPQQPPFEQLLQLALSTSVPQRSYALSTLRSFPFNPEIVLRFRANLSHSALTLRVLSLDGLLSFDSCEDSAAFRHAGFIPQAEESLVTIKAEIMKDPIMALVVHTALLPELGKLISHPAALGGAISLLRKCSQTSRDVCEEIVRLGSLSLIVQETITSSAWPCELIHAENTLELLLFLVRASKDNAKKLMDKSLIHPLWRFILVPHDIRLTALALKILSTLGKYGYAAQDVCTYWKNLTKLHSSPELADVLDVFISLSRYPHQTTPLHAIKWSLTSTALVEFEHVKGLNWRASWAEAAVQFKDGRFDSNLPIPQSLKDQCILNETIEHYRGGRYSDALASRRLALACLEPEQLSTMIDNLQSAMEPSINSTCEVDNPALAELMFTLVPHLDLISFIPRLTKGSEHVALQCLEKVCPSDIIPLYTQAVYPAKKNLLPRYLICAQSIILAETQILDPSANKSGLPFHPLWAIHIPINELLRPAGTSDALKNLQISTVHKPTETDLIYISIKFLQACCTSINPCRTQVIVAIIRILSLELDINDQSSTEIYNDEKVNPIMIDMMRNKYKCSSEIKSEPNLEMEAAKFLPEGVPFYQLYTDICGMAGSAFPNPVFNVLLIPTSMNYPKDYRLLIWSDYLTIWRGSSVLWKDVPSCSDSDGQIEWLDTEESDESVLTEYLKAIIMSTVCRNDEFFYRIAIHQLHSAISAKSLVSDVFKRQVISTLLSRGANEVLKDMISYDGRSNSSAPLCYQNSTSQKSMITYLKSWVGVHVEQKMKEIFDI